MKFKKQLLALLVLVVAFGAALGSFVLLRPESGPGDSGYAAPPPAASDARAVRENSHRLTRPAESRVTVVEFLDFECESCGAFHPVMERLKKEYGDRVTFVARYFPLPGHRNSHSAARAAEAAAQQGKFAEMHDMLFETQAEWGEAQEPKDAVFRGYARQLGLDLARYDAAVADPRTAERIAYDQRDGAGLKVQGTPTFFVEGTRVRPRGYEDFKLILDERLAASRA
ncbi:thioredoxin domain-containing protein [Streptomyces sp. NPDC097619]|uniref:DsbA family protein n=1 Tax=Streptomyces sp. NPDC097619 TaxID=3157228 RepID=UPI00333026F4